MTLDTPHVIWFEKLGKHDVPRVGGKNASLGEMVGQLASQGIRCRLVSQRQRTPTGNSSLPIGLKETIAALLDDLAAGKAPLSEVGHTSAALSCVANGPRISQRPSRPLMRALPARGKARRRCRRAFERDRRRSSRRELRRAAGDLSSISAATQRCSMRAGGATRRCSPIGPSATARPRVSTT